LSEEIPGEVVLDSRGRGFAFRRIACPTCGDGPTRKLGLRGGPHHRYGHGIATTIVQCQSCLLVFPNPFPFPVKPEELYGDPAKYFGAHDEHLKIIESRELLRSILPKAAASVSLLDVGSGRGEILLAAREIGVADAFGIETSPAMVRAARERHGLDVKQQTIETLAEASPRTFDVVILSAVLEHVHDPDSMIRSVRALTASGSIVYIDVPNEPNLLTVVGNLLNRLRGSSAVYNLAPTFEPFHVFGFNRRALTALLEKHGFQMERIKVYAHPVVPSRSELPDRVRAAAATQINRLANLTGSAGNLTAIARRK